ncbi:MAG TPA: hypothetical protein VKT70_05045, partial [Stellaceae bacterium]|nr:hypothetical protein [Stellaceae bacterium]
AHDVAGLIEGARAADVGGARPAIHAPLIAVLPVAGATGDGARSLALAMADALKRAHLAVTLERNGHEGFVVAGQVKISLPESGKQRVQVSWRVLRADGGELGHVDQDNKVIAGSLDGAWNDTALAVAGAAVNSITALIARGNGHGS